MFGIYIMLFGIACNLFVGYKIKKKVNEINRQQDELEKKD
jgi:hypothetical protein